MGNLSITAAGVLASSGATLALGTAGATITAGQPLYLDESGGTADATYKLASATGLAQSVVKGISLWGCASGQPILLAVDGLLTMATTAAGAVYCLSTDAGKIFTATDLVTSGTYVTVIGLGTATNRLYVSINNSRAALA
jgi:hypothetical protein